AREPKARNRFRLTPPTTPKRISSNTSTIIKSHLQTRNSHDNDPKKNSMKKLLLTITFLAAVFAANAQSKSVASLKDKYRGDDDFFHIELGGNFMNFAEGFKLDIDEDDLVTVAKSVEKLNFFTLPEGPGNIAEFKSLQKELEKERYELLMESSEGKGGVLIYSK